jgi:hypothetical protein
MDRMVWGSDAGMVRDFSLLPNVQTSSQAFSAPYAVTNGSLASGVVQLGCEADYSPQSGAKVKNELSFLSIPLCAFMACAGKTLCF